MKTVKFEKSKDNSNHYLPLTTDLSDWDKDHSGTYVLLTEAEAEIAALREELADIKDAHRRVMDEKCPTDEIHCTCVPALRAEIAAMREQVDELSKVHTGEGTFPCTCTSYPHSPNCGIDARIAALRERQRVLSKELNDSESVVNHMLKESGRQIERHRVLVDALERIASRGEVFDAKGTHSKWVVETARAALAAKEG